MKTITLQLPDDLLERAERRAAQRGAVLQIEIVDWIRSYGASDDHPANANVAQLIQALNAGRNTQPIGRLDRDPLHDREVLH